MNKNQRQEALIEGLKQSLRAFIAGALSALIVYLGDIDTAWAFVLMGGFMGVDKTVHERKDIDLYAKTSLGSKDNGLTPF